MQFQIDNRGGRTPQARPEFTQVGDKIIASTIWRGDDGRDIERFQVLTIRGESIVDMQGFRTRGEAERFAR